MPIIVSDPSKFVVGNTAPQTTSQPVKNSGPYMVPSLPTNKPVSSDGTRLYVNGKERKIGKKSQYLLDMLTLDD